MGRGTSGVGRSRTELGAFGFTATTLFGIGFLPQFGGPGYEAALAAGVVLPATSAITTALVVVRQELEPRPAFVRGVVLGSALALLGLLVALLHGLRAGICDLGEGVALFVLGPGFGAVLGGASGAFVGLAVRRWARGRASLAALGAFALPFGGVLVSLGRFYTSPMVFAYDPFFGYFSGPLYDTVIGSLGPLVTYRAGTLATLAALGALGVLLERRSSPDVQRAHASIPLSLAWRSRWGVAVLGGLAALASATVLAYGPELGHYQTPASIQRTLGRRVAVGRCDVVHSSTIAEADARRLANECNAHLRQIERFFGARGPERVLVYLFASDVEKGRLMGAARTYIAKPWRAEIYVQSAGYPHPVLGHELAHVVAGSFGVGPFRVSGPFGGWVPDPGRIEGVATAAAPDENDALTQEEWAATMLRLGLLPPLESLFRLSFLGKNAAQAYTASGAFIRFLHRERGAAAVRRWYGGETLSAVAGTSLSALEQRWHAALKSLPLSDAALATARARFERPAFFDRRCPRVIDRTAAEAGARLTAGDVLGAREAFTDVLDLDPRDSGARLGLAACDVRQKRLDAAIQRYATLAASADVAPWAKLAAMESRADLLLARGDHDAARAAYADLERRLVDEDRLRTVDVKKVAETGLLRDGIVTLLIGDDQGPSWDAAAPLLGERSALAPADGLADYLLARNLLGRGRLRDAARRFDRALERTIDQPRVLEEALRLRTVLGCALGELDGARRTLARFLALPLRESRRQGMQRFAERCGL